MKKNVTKSAKAADFEVRKWFLVDAKGKTLGRLCTKIASLLRGKDKPIFTPHVDCGDFVVVINAEKIEVTGNKEKDKTYFSHSGYPGGDKLLALDKVRKENPKRILEEAVRGMLPKGKLGDAIYKKLKLCVGERNPYLAQKPQAIEL